MSTAVKIESRDARSIPFQEASLDIWDKKYRLTAKDGTPIDHCMDDTYKRVARALADVEREEVREQWYEQFVWALRRGAIPAGRVTSNAGAQEHKPATSTINCTVSGTIRDSMDDILGKVHEAGLTLKAGCGIGYEFSTLRPRGAYVSGAGAYTSGPLSFMDIYDKMCFTVSSAGGRRGAQMGTFDVGHPDAMEFIRAKREAGRLRQFNLSLLVTDEFMKAVREDRDWKLAFPVTAAEVEGHDTADAAKFVWREWPTTQRLRAQRRRPGAVQGLQDPAGAAHVGRDHVVHLRLRRARLRAHRPRQRDEQQLVVREHPRHQPVRRAAAAAVRLLPAGFGQPDQLRARPVRGRRALRLGRVPRGGAGLHAHARQRGRGQRPAARAAAQRDHAQAPPRHGLPRPRLHHHHARHEVRLARRGRLHRARLAGDGARRLGSRARPGAREGPGADHERGVRGHAGDAAQAAGDEARRRARRAEAAGARAARPLQPLHAARRRGGARAGGRARQRSARASRTTARSRPPARSRCRSPTTPRTASSRRSRTTTSAT